MRRLVGLDALRGIAAVLVLLQHSLALVPGHAWPQNIIGMVDLGKLGVAIFFLISGFVIPMSLERGSLNFWIGRAFRLLPALWFSMLIAVLLGAQVTSTNQLLANAFMVTRVSGQANLIGVYWTLNWEMFFYALMSACFLIGRHNHPSTLGILAVIFAFISLFDPPFAYLVLMLVGSLLRMVLIDQNEAAKSWLAAGLGAFLGSCYAWFLLGMQPNEFFVALALALPAFWLSWNRLSGRLLVWLGSISYSLYLLHHPILKAMQTLPAAIFIPTGILVCLLVSWFSYQCIERPLVDLGKRLASMMSQRPPAVET